jgi:hypothetical protein
VNIDQIDRLLRRTYIIAFNMSLDIMASSLGLTVDTFPSDESLIYLLNEFQVLRSSPPPPVVSALK